MKAGQCTLRVEIRDRRGFTTDIWEHDRIDPKKLAKALKALNRKSEHLTEIIQLLAASGD